MPRRSVISGVADCRISGRWKRSPLATASQRRVAISGGHDVDGAQRVGGERDLFELVRSPVGLVELGAGAGAEVPLAEPGHATKGGRPPAFDREAYRQRNTVERCINRLKQWRGLATRYDKTATIYLAGLHIAGIFMWSAR